MFFCLVFLMLSRAFWSYAKKGLTSWLLFVMLIDFCYFPMWYPGSGVCFLIFAIILLRRIKRLVRSWCSIGNEISYTLPVFCSFSIARKLVIKEFEFSSPTKTSKM